MSSGIVEPVAETGTVWSVPTEDFVWGLGTLCALHHIPFDAERVVGQYPPPYTIKTLMAALDALGIRAVKTSTSALGTGIVFPCIAFQRVAGPRPAMRLSLIAKYDGAEAVAFNSLADGALVIPRAMIPEFFEPLLLHLRRERSRTVQALPAR